MEETTKLTNFGIINIDKPTGPTSYSISEYVRRELGLKKTSHMGTLDPKVTGVLPITLGRACKLASYIIHQDKSYVGILHTHTEQKLEELQALIDKQFVGIIKQTPPHRSAVKRAERKRKVHHFTLQETSENKKNFLFKCKVEGGTYIRKICSDLGEKIGGAHMGELRRTKAGIFTEKRLVRLEDFEEAVQEMKKGKEEKLQAMIEPAEKTIQKILPRKNVHKQALKSLHNGKPLHKKDLLDKNDDLKEKEVFCLFCNDEFVGIYRKTNEKTIYARPEFVKD